MQDILEQISTLRELKHLYTTGDLREYDFDTRIRTLEEEVRLFELENAPQGAQMVRDTSLWADPQVPAYIKAVSYD